MTKLIFYEIVWVPKGGAKIIHSKRLVILRAQPLTNAHMAMIMQNARMDGELVIIIGSSNRGPDIWNPLTFDERKEMIFQAIKAAGINALIEGIPDFPNDDRAWVNELQRLADAPPAQIVVSTRNQWTQNACLYAGMEIFIHDEYCGGLSASNVRKLMVDGNDAWHDLVPKEIVDYLKSNGCVQRIKQLCR